MKKLLRQKMGASAAVCKLTSSDMLCMYLYLSTTGVPTTKWLRYLCTVQCINIGMSRNYHVSLPRNKLKASNLYHWDSH